MSTGDTAFRFSSLGNFTIRAYSGAAERHIKDNYECLHSMMVANRINPFTQLYSYCMWLILVPLQRIDSIIDHHGVKTYAM